MSGILLLRGVGGTAGGGGTLGPLSWNNVYAPARTGGGAGFNNQLTISGISGTVTLTGGLSGGGTLCALKNGVQVTSPFNVVSGDKVLWEVQNLGGVTVSGTVSVSAGLSLIDSFTYVVGYA